MVVVDPDTWRECARARFDDGGGLANAGDAIGEIVNRTGAPNFEGYYKNPDGNAERVRDDWYWSGDLGYRDEAGYFYFAGRGGDWLRVDSENFAAAPVERVVERHPDVAAAAVYAVPDPRSGDQVMAALELRPGAAFDPDGFAAFLGAQPDLGTKWSPRFVRVSPASPSPPPARSPRRRCGPRAGSATTPSSGAPVAARSATGSSPTTTARALRPGIRGATAAPAPARPRTARLLSTSRVPTCSDR